MTHDGGTKKHMMDVPHSRACSPQFKASRSRYSWARRVMHVPLSRRGREGGAQTRYAFATRKPPPCPPLTSTKPCQAHSLLTARLALPRPLCHTPSPPALHSSMCGERLRGTACHARVDSARSRAGSCEEIASSGEGRPKSPAPVDMHVHACMCTHAARIASVIRPRRPAQPPRSLDRVGGDTCCRPRVTTSSREFDSGARRLGWYVARRLHLHLVAHVETHHRNDEERDEAGGCDAARLRNGEMWSPVGSGATLRDRIDALARLVVIVRPAVRVRRGGWWLG